VQSLRYNLEKQGYLVTAAGDGRSAVALAASEEPDLVILDIMLPLLDGIEACKEIRKTSSVPIIMLTAKDQEFDKVLALELGADDYVTKPFSPREVVARIRALARRGGMSDALAPVLLRYDRLEIDEAAREVRVDGRDLAFKPREFALLLQLASNPGVAFSRANLLEAVWGYDFAGDERTVDVHVRRLRAKLEDEAAMPRVVQTIHGFGYKFARG
jgi:DNA-binding response OmpR family regulator